MTEYLILSLKPGFHLGTVGTIGADALIESGGCRDKGIRSAVQVGNVVFAIDVAKSVPTGKLSYTGTLNFFPGIVPNIDATASLPGRDLGARIDIGHAKAIAKQIIGTGPFCRRQRLVLKITIGKDKVTTCICGFQHPQRAREKALHGSIGVRPEVKDGIIEKGTTGQHRQKIQAEAEPDCHPEQGSF